MEVDRKPSWTGWFLLAIALGLFHLAILFPLSAVLAFRHPGLLEILFVIGTTAQSVLGPTAGTQGWRELIIVANSFAYGVLGAFGVYLWQRRKRPPA